MLNRRSNGSNAFEEYLRRQSPERRAAITAAEKRYAAVHSAHLASYEETFKDIMHGYQETPAGPGRSTLVDEQVGGYWSWKPFRDRAAGYDKESTFTTFLGVPRSAAELVASERQAAGEPGAIRYGGIVA